MDKLVRIETLTHMQYVRMKFNLGDKTVDSSFQESMIPLFYPPDKAALMSPAGGL